jgi:hypothetical protein
MASRYEAPDPLHEGRNDKPEYEDSRGADEARYKKTDAAEQEPACDSNCPKDYKSPGTSNVPLSLHGWASYGSAASEGSGVDRCRADLGGGFASGMAIRCLLDLRPGTAWSGEATIAICASVRPLVVTRTAFDPGLPDAGCLGLVASGDVELVTFGIGQQRPPAFL